MRMMRIRLRRRMVRGDFRNHDDEDDDDEDDDEEEEEEEDHL